MPTGISRRALTLALGVRLATISNAILYAGEVGVGFPGSTVPVVPPTVDGSDGRVKAYLVVYPSPGTPTREQDLADTTIDLDWLIQITCVAGYADVLTALVDRVDALCYRWAPTIAGAVCSGLRPPPGFDPGPFQRDRDYTPNRLWTPLQYRLTATT